MQPIIIIGTGRKGRIALEILQANQITVYGFLDDDNSREGDIIGNVPILGSQKDPIFLGMLGEKCAAFVALEDSTEQKNYIQKWQKENPIPTLNAIHPHAYLASQVSLGEGNLINLLSSIGTEVKIGSYNTVEEQVVIGQAVQIDNHVHICPGTIIGGGAIIHSGAQIGAGAIVMNDITIGENVSIPTGKVIQESIGI
ncbi:MAG: hypothetical protein AAF770_01855 [Bacteroidota bacterium]